MGPSARTCGDTRGCRTAPAASWRTMRQAWSSITLSTTSSGFTRPSLDAGNDRWSDKQDWLLGAPTRGSRSVGRTEIHVPDRLALRRPTRHDRGVRSSADVLPDGPEVFAGPRLTRRGPSGWECK